MCGDCKYFKSGDDCGWCEKHNYSADFDDLRCEDYQEEK